MEPIVVISANPDFALSKEDQHCDLWIVDTPANLLTADALRASTLAKSVTTFRDRGNATMNVIVMLPTILDHHPDCTRIIVKGVASKDHHQIIQETPELLPVASDGDTLIFSYDAQYPLA